MANTPEMKELIVEQQLKIRQLELDNRDTAKKHIACIEITYTEGEGL